MRKSIPLFASVVLALAPVATSASETGLLLRARVAVHCTIDQLAPGAGTPTGGGYSLGEFREFCNAAGGYNLIVRYTPGTLRGTVITAGEDRAVLDGSGEAVLSRASGPRLRERSISAMPGERGFDTERVEFLLDPM